MSPWLFLTIWACFGLVFYGGPWLLRRRRDQEDAALAADRAAVEAMIEAARKRDHDG